MSFFGELKRRNVFKVAVAFGIVGWLLAQLAEFATDTFGVPDWVLQIFVVFLVLGFPVALLWDPFRESAHALPVVDKGER